jgi:hypothetical protein
MRTGEHVKVDSCVVYPADRGKTGCSGHDERHGGGQAAAACGAGSGSLLRATTPQPALQRRASA